jgi:hypothetical protein
MIWVAEYKPFTLVGLNNLLNYKQRRILDNNKYMKTLHNPKMLLTNDPIVSVRSDSVLGASRLISLYVAAIFWNRKSLIGRDSDLSNWIRVYLMVG